MELPNAHAQVMRCHFEGAAGAGTGLFKDQGDVLSLAEAVGNALFLFVKMRFCHGGIISRSPLRKELE